MSNALDGPAHLGDRVQDVLTGFKGVMVARTRWLHGCDRLVVEADTLNDKGEPPKPQTFDEQRIKVLERQVLPITEKPWPEIKLGSKVKDSITGFEGVVVACSLWLSGNVHMTIEPDTLDDKGLTKDTAGFDVERIVLIEPRPVPVTANATNALPGGPPRGESASVPNR